MEKHVSGLLVVLAVLCLLVGGLVGYTMAPADIETVNKYVDRNVTVEVEVPVEVPSILDSAVATFLEAVEDEEDEAGNDVDVLGSYDFDEVEVSRVYDDYTVSYDDEVTTVDFSIKLRFDEDGEASEKETYDVTVIFEEEDDTIVEVEVA